MIFRKATLEDIEQISALRIALLIEEAASEETDITTELQEYFRGAMSENMIVTVAEEKGEVVATSAVIFQKYPPSFANKLGMRAYITNVYTKPEYRRQGISSRLMDLLVEEAKTRGVRHVWLWATEQGVPMYKKYGFEDLQNFTTMIYELDTNE